MDIIFAVIGLILIGILFLRAGRLEKKHEMMPDALRERDRKQGKFRILLIDDDKFLLQIWKDKFEKAGQDVIALPEVKADFVTQIHEINPDVVISDVIRPEPSGLEILRALRGDERTKSIPFIFQSTTMGSNSDILKEAQELGISDHIFKAEAVPSQVVERVITFLSTRFKK